MVNWLDLGLSGNLPVIDAWVSATPKEKQDLQNLFRGLARGGHLDALLEQDEWSRFMQKRHSPDEVVIDQLQWGYTDENHLEWLCYGAAEGGHLHILKAFYSNFWGTLHASGAEREDVIREVIRLGHTSGRIPLGDLHQLYQKIYLTSK